MGLQSGKAPSNPRLCTSGLSHHRRVLPSLHTTLLRMVRPDVQQMPAREASFGLSSLRGVCQGRPAGQKSPVAPALQHPAAEPGLGHLEMPTGQRPSHGTWGGWAASPLHVHPHIFMLVSPDDSLHDICSCSLYLRMMHFMTSAAALSCWLGCTGGIPCAVITQNAACCLPAAAQCLP